MFRKVFLKLSSASRGRAQYLYRTQMQILALRFTHSSCDYLCNVLHVFLHLRDGDQLDVWG